MSCPLPVDCLNEIFENLYDDKITLHSCLLVSRLWCKISVGILWRDFWGMEYDIYNSKPRVHSHCKAVMTIIPPLPTTLRLEIRVASAILSTLISCLPNESKELLHENKIEVKTPTSKQPLFNYAAFCKALSINSIFQLIYTFVGKDKLRLVAKEILKMFMNKVPSLKMLEYTYDGQYDEYDDEYTPYNIPFINFFGARDCLTALSELQCGTDIDSEFFYELSQICHNLRSLAIYFEGEVSNELKDLVSSQNNLKNLKLSFYGDENNDWVNILPVLMKHTNTLTKLQLQGDVDLSLSFAFVSSFLNLQEIEFSFSESKSFKNFRELQYVNFPKLQVLKIPMQVFNYNRNVKTEYLVKFLEINGKNLQECYLNNYASELSIDKFCPNIKKLSVAFENELDNELDTMKTIFNSCQDLEGILIQHKEALEIVAKHSPKNFYELLIFGLTLYPEDLESFFISWGNRKSKKSLSLIIVDNSEMNKENMEIIEKYRNLGVVKKFEFREFREYQFFDQDFFYF